MNENNELGAGPLANEGTKGLPVVAEPSGELAEPAVEAAEIEVAGTPSSKWSATGQPDPHGQRYNCERAELVMGDMTDDELANGVFMHGNEPLNIEALMSGKPGYHPPIAWLTAAKDRIRWLSRLAGVNQQAGSGVPEGWRLVPIEPTEEMAKAARNPNGETMDGYPNPATYAERYKAMLAAAPLPPSPAAKAVQS